MNTLQSVSRRKFIKGVGATVVLMQFPFWQSCQSASGDSVLTSLQFKTAQSVLQILFPSKPKPGIDDINIFKALNMYLTDTEINPDDQKFIINGLHWTNETAKSIYNENFSDLPNGKQQKIFNDIIGENWGEYWLSGLLNISFEALLLDPIYGINTHEAGWRWLQHKPGVPRPQIRNKYPGILNRKKEEIIITNINQIADEKTR